MRILMLVAVAALALSGCGKMPLSSAGDIAPIAATAADVAGVPAPATFADKTTLDESTGIAFETGITAAANLATLAVKTGVIKGTANLEWLRGLVGKARVAVAGVRAAYRTGNATSYKAAVAEASNAIGAVGAFVASKGAKR